MKKICVLILTILLLVVAIVPVTAMAQSTTKTAEQNQNIHLLNPVAITYNENKLYIADNISATESVLHIFDISTDTPQFVDTLEFDGNITKLHTIDNTVLALQSNKFNIISYDGEKFSVSSTSLTSTRIDMTIVDGTHYIMKSTALYYDENTGAGEKSLTTSPFTDGKAVVAIDKFVYFLYGSSYNSYYTNGRGEFGTVQTVDASTLGIIDWNGQVATFTANDIVMKDNSTKYDLSPKDTSIRDMVSQGTTLYVLTNNSVAKWTYDVEGFTQQENFVIGSDTVTLTPPTLDSIDSYTLATAKGYPANIIYKTTDKANTIPELIDNAEQKQFVILGYTGDTDSNFYYVYVEGKFGWIRKSATQLSQDDKISVIDTDISSSQIEYKSSFVSANAVYIYHLPCALDEREKFVKTKHTQSSDARTEVTILQQFSTLYKERWYYVSYVEDGTTKYGFVLNTDLGYIYSTAAEDAEIVLDGTTPHQKINATLWDNVGMYLTEELADDQKLIDEKTEQHIKLSSGTLVNVIKRTELASYVQVVNADGSSYFGWVSNNFLIDVHAITTNTAIGISIMFVAIAIAIATVVIILRRKHIAKKNPTIDLDIPQE